ncbi:MAG TPA: phage tail protein [Blastocatellia bacterium]|nr:phage tail protein [Blastocatellia bacterium]
MSDPYIGEIRMFGGTFAPAGWALCNGALVPISENDALFVLLGTTYGGDGENTFALPDLQGRIPVHQGSTTQIGEKNGVEAVALSVQQIPAHSHPVIASTSVGTQDIPTNNIFAASTSQLYFLPTAGLPINATMRANTVTGTGGNLPHDNMAPYLVLTFIISLFGVFPTQ